PERGVNERDFLLREAFKGGRGAGNFDRQLNRTLTAQKNSLSRSFVNLLAKQLELSPNNPFG
ncbi:MAG: hypothetical protein WBE96_25740, partial [Pseudolabrys sp.]